MSNNAQKQSEQYGVHMMAKPIGPVCNLKCEYCFYLEKEALFPDEENYHMSDEVLEAYISKYIAFQPGTEVVFAWQGGEPTMMGIEFFQKAIRLQKKYAHSKQISNTFQTNGTLLNDKWCQFLAKHNFLVGLSLDGPEEIHNEYRIDKGGKPTFDHVIRALRLLQKHRVEFNVLACVNRTSSQRPLDVYRFFKQQGVEFIQFIPIVEREPDENDSELGLHLAAPPVNGNEHAHVTSWSVGPQAYGDFLVRIFNEWVRKDVGSVFIMNFEWTLATWAGVPSVACFFAPRCGSAVILEHNGDVYSCDHFMYPKYRLGNIVDDDLKSLVRSPQQLEFGALKETTLPKYCRTCEMLPLCRGECPKHRFMQTPDGEAGLNYLCPSYQKYFRSTAAYMSAMAQLIKQGKPVTDIMQAQTYYRSDSPIKYR
jgi:serine-type anaerobic sulfatase-maturating enzyme